MNSFAFPTNQLPEPRTLALSGIGAGVFVVSCKRCGTKHPLNNFPRVRDEQALAINCSVHARACFFCLFLSLFGGLKRIYSGVVLIEQ